MIRISLKTTSGGREWWRVVAGVLLSLACGALSLVVGLVWLCVGLTSILLTFMVTGVVVALGKGVAVARRLTATWR